MPLDKKAAVRFNFQIFGGESTGTYTFITVFRRLTKMLTDFQRIMDEILEGLSNTYTFIDDFLIVTKAPKRILLRKIKRFWRDKIA